MRNLLVIFSIIQLVGCASVRYPDWELVKIESTVINKPCESKIVYAEHCNDEPCDDWFKKRATIYNANTVVRHKNSYASYFNCAPGLPPYQDKPNKPIDKVNTTLINKKEPETAKNPQIETDLDKISLQLKKLKSLKDEGILNIQEYESRRKTLVDKLNFN